MPLVTWRMLERNFDSTEDLAGSSAKFVVEPKRIKIRNTIKIRIGEATGRSRRGIEDLVRRFQ